MRQLLAGSELTRDHDDAARGTDTCEPVQDRYSVRCLPQFVGPVADGLRTIAYQVETEINSTTDNPLIDVDGDTVRHLDEVTDRLVDDRHPGDRIATVLGGNFLAQYVGIGMDQLRHYLGLLAKHLDAQIAVLSRRVVPDEASVAVGRSLEDGPFRLVQRGRHRRQVRLGVVVACDGSCAQIDGLQPEDQCDRQVVAEHPDRLAGQACRTESEAVDVLVGA